MSPRSRPRAQSLNQAANQALYETSKRHLLRAVTSPSQLREQMTWFWMNHFSVFSGKANLRWTIAEYEEAIRAPRVRPVQRARDGDGHVARDARVSRQRPERRREDQRELRARADGAAHARRQRRPERIDLHAAGRAGAGPDPHRRRRQLHRPAAAPESEAAAALRQTRRVRVQSGEARLRREDGARPHLPARRPRRDSGGRRDAVPSARNRALRQSKDRDLLSRRRAAARRSSIAWSARFSGPTARSPRC